MMLTYIKNGHDHNLARSHLENLNHFRLTSKSGVYLTLLEAYGPEGTYSDEEIVDRIKKHTIRKVYKDVKIPERLLIQFNL